MSAERRGGMLSPPRREHVLKEHGHHEAIIASANCCIRHSNAGDRRGDQPSTPRSASHESPFESVALSVARLQHRRAELECRTIFEAATTWMDRVWVDARALGFTNDC